MSAKSQPDSVGPEEQFFRFIRDGRFMIQKNRATGAYVFYPRVGAHDPERDQLEWVEASGLGKVDPCPVARTKPELGRNYSLALVDLAEGPRMFTRVVGTDPG